MLTMSKLSTFLATALFAAAGAAHAGLLGPVTAMPGAPVDAWASSWNFSNAAFAGVVNPGKEVDGVYAAQFNGNADRAATQALKASDSDGISVDFLFQYSGNLQNNDFVGFWFGDQKGPSIGLKANCGDGSCSNDVFVRLGGTEGVFLANSDLVAGTTYRLFGYLYKTNGSQTYNNFDAWLNPTQYEMTTFIGADAHAGSSVAGSGTTDLQTVGVVGFRTANLDSGVTVRVDNVDIDPNAVPEPGTLALMGLAMAGLGLARRRKQN
jgi:hypothetical protein